MCTLVLIIHDSLLEFTIDYFFFIKLIVFIESLDELEGVVVELFSEVENNNVEAPRWNEYPFEREQLKTCTYMVPIKDLRNLHVIFPSPDLMEYYKSQVHIYLFHGFTFNRFISI